MKRKYLKIRMLEWFRFSSNRRSAGLLKQLKTQRGGFTLEATLIFPAIFMTIVIFILLSLVIYQKIDSYYVSSQAAERIAFTWNNSHKNVLDGSFPYHLQDPLYWRLTDDQLLGIFLGRSSNTEAVVYTSDRLPDPGNTDQLLNKKLSRMLHYYPGSKQGTLFYHHSMLGRKVQVTTENPIQIPRILQKWLGTTLVSSAESRVIDPVELIRTLDLARYYADNIMDGRRMNQILEQQKEKQK